MNSEGRKTPNTNSNMDERVQKSKERRDHAKASQASNTQTPPPTSTSQASNTQTPPPTSTAQEKLEALKKQYGITSQNKTPDSPSASSKPSPSL